MIWSTPYRPTVSSLASYRRYQVFVSFTYLDLRDEPQAVIGVIACNEVPRYTPSKRGNAIVIPKRSDACASDHEGLHPETVDSCFAVLECRP